MKEVLVQLKLRVPEELRSAVQAKAEAQDKSVNKAVAELLQSWVEGKLSPSYLAMAEPKPEPKKEVKVESEPSHSWLVGAERIDEPSDKRYKKQVDPYAAINNMPDNI